MGQLKVLLVCHLGLAIAPLWLQPRLVHHATAVSLLECSDACLPCTFQRAGQGSSVYEGSGHVRKYCKGKSMWDTVFTLRLPGRSLQLHSLFVGSHACVFNGCSQNCLWTLILHFHPCPHGFSPSAWAHIWNRCSSSIHVLHSRQDSWDVSGVTALRLYKGVAVHLKPESSTTCGGPVGLTHRLVTFLWPPRPQHLLVLSFLHPFNTPSHLWTNIHLGSLGFLLSANPLPPFPCCQAGKMWKIR